MKKTIEVYMILFLFFRSLPIMAAICPDPDTSSLRWGAVPAPWVINPFSENRPQGGSETRFVHANILVAGMGRGVMCTYQHSMDYFSIWWQIGVKTPGYMEASWHESLGGFECTDSIIACVFYP